MRHCEEHPRAFFPKANCDLIETAEQGAGSLERILSEEGYVKSRSPPRRAALSRSQSSSLPAETLAKPGSNCMSSLMLHEGLHWSTEGGPRVTSVQVGCEFMAPSG